LVDFLRRRFGLESAEDLAQQTYVHLARSGAGSRSPRALLAITALNAARDQARRRKARPRLVQDEAAIARGSYPPDQAETLLLKPVVLSLPHNLRAAFLLSRFAGLTYDLLVDTDNYGFTLETVGFVENGQIGPGAPPWIDPAAYVRASPFFAAPRLTTPPAADRRRSLDLGSTILQQSERLYAALLRCGDPAVLIRYWGEGHVQADPGAVRDQWTRIGAWFGRYLKDGGRDRQTVLGSDAGRRSPHLASDHRTVRPRSISPVVGVRVRRSRHETSRLRRKVLILGASACTGAGRTA
jgi:hypothetical protein